MSDVKLRKIPSKYDSKELLDLLETSEDSKLIDNPENDVINFLISLQIKSGDYKVKGQLLYDLYRRWSLDPFEMTTFYKTINLYLEKTSPRIFFFIDRDSLQLSKDAEKYLQDSSVRVLKKPSNKRHFEKFLEVHNITSGDHWFESHFLFDIYDKWIYKTKRTKSISKVNFNLFCKLYFKNKLICRNYYRTIYFKLDKSVETLISVESKERIKVATRKDYARHTKKEKKQKRIKRISSIRSAS